MVERMARHPHVDIIQKAVTRQQFLSYSEKSVDVARQYGRRHTGYIRFGEGIARHFKQSP
jgi:hypothetical protein